MAPGGVQRGMAKSRKVVSDLETGTALATQLMAAQEVVEDFLRAEQEDQRGDDTEDPPPLSVPSAPAGREKTPTPQPHDKHDSHASAPSRRLHGPRGAEALEMLQDMEEYFNHLMSGKDSRMASVLKREQATAQKLKVKVQELTTSLQNAKADCVRLAKEKEEALAHVRLLEQTFRQQQIQLQHQKESVESSAVKTLQAEIKNMQAKMKVQEKMLTALQDRQTSTQATLRHSVLRLRADVVDLRLRERGCSVMMLQMKEWMGSTLTNAMVTVRHHSQVSTAFENLCKVYEEQTPQLTDTITLIQRKLVMACSSRRIHVKETAKPEDTIDITPAGQLRVKLIQWLNTSKWCLNALESVLIADTVAHSPTNITSPDSSTQDMTAERKMTMDPESMGSLAGLRGTLKAKQRLRAFVKKPVIADEFTPSGSPTTGPDDIDLTIDPQSGETEADPDEVTPTSGFAAQEEKKKKKRGKGGRLSAKSKKNSTKLPPI